MILGRCRIDPEMTNLSDVTLVVGPSQTPLYAHTLVLSLASPYYKHLFSSTWSARTHRTSEPNGLYSLGEGAPGMDDCVDIPDFSVTAIETTLVFMYHDDNGQDSLKDLNDETLVEIITFTDSILFESLWNTSVVVFGERCLKHASRALDFYKVVYPRAVQQERKESHANTASIDNASVKGLVLKAIDLIFSNVSKAVQGYDEYLSTCSATEMIPILLNARPHVTEIEKWQFVVVWIHAMQTRGGELRSPANEGNRQSWLPDATWKESVAEITPLFQWTRWNPQDVRDHLEPHQSWLPSSVWNAVQQVSMTRLRPMVLSDVSRILSEKQSQAVHEQWKNVTLRRRLAEGFPVTRYYRNSVNNNTRLCIMAQVHCKEHHDTSPSSASQSPENARKYILVGMCTKAKGEKMEETDAQVWYFDELADPNELIRAGPSNFCKHVDFVYWYIHGHIWRGWFKPFPKNQYNNVSGFLRSEELDLIDFEVFDVIKK